MKYTQAVVWRQPPHCSLPRQAVNAQVPVSGFLERQTTLYFLENRAGEIEIPALPVGLYHVSLMVDGKAAGTERLLVF